LGCADPQSCNYDPAAGCLDYLTCDYSCLGCTDPAAPNYDSTATQDDGTCCYNNWYTISASESFYWYIIDQNMNYYGGIYPDQNGFCSLDDCFTLQAYSISGNALSLEIINQNGVVLYSGTSSNGNYYDFISVSNTSEISGCTDPNSCNYNSQATCDDGSCNLCFGCTNPSALNYDAWAWFDDGTCIYEMLPPLMGMTMLPDEINNQFWVRVEMMDEGNGAPYLLSSNFDRDFIFVLHRVACGLQIVQKLYLAVCFCNVCRHDDVVIVHELPALGVTAQQPIKRKAFFVKPVSNILH
jgi:hypothetical protein